MKHPNDKKLSELLKKKILEFENNDSNTDQLWMNIEESLPAPQKSSFLVVSSISILFLLLTFLWINKPKVEDLTKDSPSEIQTLNPTSNAPQLPFDFDAQDSSNQVMHSLISPEVIDEVSTSTNVAIQHEKALHNKIYEPRTKNAGDSEINRDTGNDYSSSIYHSEFPLVKRKKNIIIHPLSLKGITVDEKLIQEKKYSNTTSSSFLYAKGAITYHTLDPILSDEILIGESLRKVSLIDRISFGIGFGIRRKIFEQVYGRFSTGLYYNRSKLYFQSYSGQANEVELDVSRLDADVGIGFDFDRRGFISRNEMISVSLTGRSLLIDLSNTDFPTYNDLILSYDIAYYFRFNRLAIGPYYSSFINSMGYSSVGKIRPNIFGVTIRRGF